MKLGELKKILEKYDDDYTVHINGHEYNDIPQEKGEIIYEYHERIGDNIRPSLGGTLYTEPKGDFDSLQKILKKERDKITKTKNNIYPDYEITSFYPIKLDSIILF